jgi:hypothetical protein
VPHRLGKLALLLVAALMGACSAEVASPDEPQPYSAPPPVGNEGGEQEEDGESCTPEVAGLVPTRHSSIAIECPTGWKRRTAKAISGRFTSYAELVDALCIAETEDSDPRSVTNDLGIDFSKNDVYATPYDPATRSAPALNKRGANELWIRVQATSCSGGATSTFAIALFVVPKDAKVVEQTCSASCQY